MVAYQDFVALSQSGDSEERGQAAHLAAQAYLGHTGPADEHAALYAALIGFLDDPSVRVRARAGLWPAARRRGAAPDPAGAAAGQRRSSRAPWRNIRRR